MNLDTVDVLGVPENADSVDLELTADLVEGLLVIEEL